MKRYLNKLVTRALLLAVGLAILPLFSITSLASTGNSGDTDHISHVLLLSIDGMHEQDLARYVALHPNSGLAQLTHLGTTYTNASASKPSDSFPGLLAMAT